jgi:hypothetical protein
MHHAPPLLRTLTKRHALDPRRLWRLQPRRPRRRPGMLLGPHPRRPSLLLLPRRHPMVKSLLHCHLDFGTH